MNFIDVFAWVVLLVVIALAIATIVALGSLPGYIARRRGHPWSEAVSAGSWAAIVFGLVLWPLVLMWAYVDTPARKDAAR